MRFDTLYTSEITYQNSVQYQSRVKLVIPKKYSPSEK
jgi:hypothetical protein